MHEVESGSSNEFNQIAIMQRNFINTFKRVTELHGEQVLSEEFWSLLDNYFDRMNHFIHDEDPKEEHQLSYKQLDEMNRLFWESIIQTIQDIVESNHLI